jgi:copper chaperone CopZ
MPTQKFRVPGLTREDESRVEQHLKQLRGVLYVSASHAAACAEIEFEDDTISLDAIRQALADLGYQANIVG